MIAIVLRQQISRVSGDTLGRWLRESGIDPDGCEWLTLIAEKDPKEAAIRDAVERVLAELDALPDLTAIVAVGRYGVRLDAELWRGGILRSHGHSGRLRITDTKSVNAIALFDPYTYVRHLKDGNTRRAIETENSCKLVLSRIVHMGEPVFLPDVRETPRVLVSGVVGLDTETHPLDADGIALKKSITKNKVEPRILRLKMVGLSDGQVSFSGADFAADAEPIAWNMPFDAIVTGNWQTRWHDGKMVAHLLGERDTELKSMGLRWLGRPMMHYDEAGGTDREPSYCVADATTHKDLLEEGLRRAPAGIRNVYDLIERPMLRLYARWSMQGVFALDRPGAEALFEAETGEIEVLRLRIEKLTGGVVVNPNSNEQIAAYVFGWTKESGKDCPTVDAKVLSTKTHMRGVPELQALKLKRKRTSTYLGAWLQWPLERLGCLWRPAGAWTGRPSVGALQLHNVPADLRRFLIPAPGKVLRSFDNSQLEIRVAAHISQDRNMIRLLRGETPGYEDGDIHRWATDLLSRRVGRKLPRTFGKIGNFSTLYGGSEAAIYSQAPKYGATMDEIRPVARLIHAALPEMFADFFAWKKQVERLPRVPGLFGAVLIPPPHPDESYLMRERVNAPIQRGAVDIVKLQTLALEDAGYRTVHQIHDEVIIELDERDDTPDNERIVKHIMANAVRLDVPVKVDSKLWGKAA